MSQENRSSTEGRRRPLSPPQRAGALAILGVALVLGGCAAFYEAPTVRILGLRVASLGISSGTAELDLELINEHGSSIDFQGVRYRVDVHGPPDEDDGPGWIKLGEGFHAEELTLRSGDTTRVTVQVPFEYEAVGAAVRSFLREGEVRYRFDGDLWIQGGLGQIQIPIRSQGSVGP